MISAPLVPAKAPTQEPATAVVVCASPLPLLPLPQPTTTSSLPFSSSPASVTMLLRGARPMEMAQPGFTTDHIMELFIRQYHNQRIQLVHVSCLFRPEDAEGQQGRLPSLFLTQLRPLLNQPLVSVAHRFQVSMTLMKKICRRNGKTFSRV